MSYWASGKVKEVRRRTLGGGKLVKLEYVQLFPHRKIAAEFLGTALLVATVVGSGIMAQNLSPDIGVQLTMNALSTIATLGIIIWVFLPVSGAHFNPVVTLMDVVRKQQPVGEGVLYIVAQCLGGVAGAALAHSMFGKPLWFASENVRTGTGTWIGEIVATAGLLFVIVAMVRRGAIHLIPVIVPAWIMAAYIFTSSTSFANPAVTLGRMGTDTFSGIAPASLPLFVVMQIIGAGLGTAAAHYFVPEIESTTDEEVV